MARPVARARAIVFFATVGRMVAGMVGLVALVPALVVNVDWTGASGWGWAAAAAASIVFSAVFFEASRRAASFVWTPVFLIFGLALIVNNTIMAFDNASHRSDHRSDHRKALQNDAKNRQSERSRLVAKSEAATKIAGERSQKAYEADIAVIANSDPPRWAATGQCDTANTTARASGAFCAPVAGLRAKLAEAKARDEADAKIAELDKLGEGKEIPTAVDAGSEAIVALLKLMAVRVASDVETAQRSLVTVKDLVRAIILEAIAALGPSAWLLVCDGIFSPVRGEKRAPAALTDGRQGSVTGAAPRSARENAPAPNKTPHSVYTPVTMVTVNQNDHFHTFLAAKLETATGSVMRAGEPWEMWLTWCAENNKDAGSQKVFGGKMKAHFAWQSNHNRPRYLNVRAKASPPVLRVVPA